VGPIGVWSVLLFAAVLARQGALEHAISLIAYVFSELEWSWFFVLLALVPALLVLLAAVQWVRPSEGAVKPSLVKWGGVLVTLACVGRHFILGLTPPACALRSCQTLGVTNANLERTFSPRDCSRDMVRDHVRGMGQ
jgi:hypothetical protein